MTEIEIELDNKSYNVLDLIQDEIDKIKKNLPEDYNGIARFLRLMRPVVEVALLNCGDWADEVEHTGPGRKPISHASLMLIHVLAKYLMVSYRQVERELNERPELLKALELSKAPSHSKLSDFRTKMGEDFFKKFFCEIRDLLFRLELIKGEGVIADSAPIIASMNLARANCTPKVDENKVREFFADLDVSPVINGLNVSGKSKYAPEPLVRFFIFEVVGGFRSRAQALRFLNENPGVAAMLGFENGVIPVQATFTNFTNKHGEVSVLLAPVLDQVKELLDYSDAIPNNSGLNFFSACLGQILRDPTPTPEWGIVRLKN